MADDVLQLAHVARPGVGQHRGLGRRREAGEALVIFGRVLPEEFPGDDQHVVVAFAQRRQVDGHDMQAVEQVLAEAAGIDLGLRVAVGGADDADVDRRRLVLADPLDRAGLQEAQHLGLQAKIHLADFVEEQRAAIGLAGSAGAVRGGAGEGALHMAEDLAFQQVARDGGAVDGDERLVATAAELVQGIGAELLAGAALAGDEHGGLAGGRVLQDAVDRLHGHGMADEVAEAVAAGFFLDLGDLLLELAPFQCVAHRDAQAVGGERLGQEVERPLPHRFDGQTNRGLAGDDHDLDRQAAAADLAHQVDAVHVGQVHVENENGGRRGGQDGQRRLAVAGDLDRAVLGLQVFGIGLGKCRSILDDQYPATRPRHSKHLLV